MLIRFEKFVDGAWYEYGTYDLANDYDLAAFMQACKFHKGFDTRAVRL